MPVSYQFEGRVVVVQLEAGYSFAALMEAVRASLADARCPPNPVLLLDASAGFVPVGITANDLHALGRFLAAVGGACSHTIALVAPSEVGFGLLRACAGHAAAMGVTACVFREATAARDWLALSPEQLAGAQAGGSQAGRPLSAASAGP